MFFYIIKSLKIKKCVKILSMNEIYKNNEKEIILKNMDAFNPEHIFLCGQAFRWELEEDGSFTNVAHDRVINISKKEKDIIIKNSDEDDFNKIWRNYFDLNRDYLKIINDLSEDQVLKRAIEYGRGIRILNQDPFETIISFIISANNNIKRIKKSIKIISQMYGEKIENPFGTYYSFPKAEVLKNADPKDLREFAKVGFRDERIVKAANMIYDEEIDINSFYTKDLKLASEELQKLPGVGPKVSDCILLFAYGRSESFPVDVWIKRVMEELYFKETVKKTEVADRGRELFKDFAGFAQQYLFFYGRENKLGKI